MVMKKVKDFFAGLDLEEATATPPAAAAPSAPVTPAPVTPAPPTPTVTAPAPAPAPVPEPTPAPVPAMTAAQTITPPPGAASPAAPVSIIDRINAGQTVSDAEIMQAWRAEDKTLYHELRKLS